MSEPKHWNFLAEAKLDDDEVTEMSETRLPNYEAFLANVRRRCVLLGLNVDGDVIDAGGDNKVVLHFSGDAFSELNALMASMEVYHVLATGRAADPSTVAVTEAMN